MKKIETIWRELLFQTIEKGRREFTQKDLALKFGFSTSTVFQALKAPREMGAVRVTGRYFVLEDPEKLCFYWASFRNLTKDVIFSGHVDLPLGEIEGLIPPDSIYGCYSAAVRLLKSAPADYDTAYIYTNDVGSLKARYTFSKGRVNLIVLKADSRMGDYGGITTLAQTFVDLWNLSDWQAKEFTKVLKEQMDAKILP